jgi:hypothetical protein
MPQEEDGATHDATKGHDDDVMCDVVEDHVDTTVDEQNCDVR